MKGKKCMLDWLFRAGEPVSVISFCCNDMVNPSNWFLLLLRTRIYIYTFVNIFIIAWQIPAMEWMSVIEMFVITLQGQGGDWGVRESDEPETYRLIISSPPGLGADKRHFYLRSDVLSASGAGGCATLLLICLSIRPEQRLQRLIFFRSMNWMTCQDETDHQHYISINPKIPLILLRAGEAFVLPRESN